MGFLSLLMSARFVLPVLASRWTWAVVIICSSIIFTSGIMFVRIRGTPWVGRTQTGSSWLAGGYQNQYGMEVQVIAGVCECSSSRCLASSGSPLPDGTLAFSYVALIFLVPRILSPAKQRIAVYIWCCVILLLFSVLLSLFSVKNQGTLFR
jgi:oligosaccharyltransferase complex subunit gamma